MMRKGKGKGKTNITINLGGKGSKMPMGAPPPMGPVPAGLGGPAPMPAGAPPMPGMKRGGRVKGYNKGGDLDEPSLESKTGPHEQIDDDVRERARRYVSGEAAEAPKKKTPAARVEASKPAPKPAPKPVPGKDYEPQRAKTEVNKLRSYASQMSGTPKREKTTIPKGEFSFGSFAKKLREKAGITSYARGGGIERKGKTRGRMC